MASYQIVDTVIPAGSGVAVVARDPVMEEIARIPSMLCWFDPAAPYVQGGDASSFRYRDKKAGVFFLASGNNRPENSLINGQPALSMGEGTVPIGNAVNGSLLASDVPLLGDNKYTIAFGMQLSESAAGTIVGGAIAESGISIQISGTTGFVSFHTNVDQVFNLRQAVDRRNSKIVVVLSFSEGQMVSRINGAEVGRAVGITQTLTTKRLRLGANGAPGAATAAVQGVRVGQFMTFSQDLSRAEREIQLLRVESHLRTLYGV